MAGVTACERALPKCLSSSLEVGNCVTDPSTANSLCTYHLSMVAAS
jgi:hypothetical protein